MKYKIFTPTDYANAVFNDRIVGPPIASTLNQVGDPDLNMVDNINDSHKYCMKVVMDKMKLYQYNPMLLTDKTPLTKFRKIEQNFMKGHKSYASQRSNFIYCKDCFNMKVDNIEDVSCCVIATTTYKEVADVVDGVKSNVRASVEVKALIPHSSQCTLDHQSRRNYKMDAENEGRGWDVFSFPVDEIFRDTYTNICNALENVAQDGVHYGMLYLYINRIPLLAIYVSVYIIYLTNLKHFFTICMCIIITGTKISNITKRNLPPYNFDNRYYIKTANDDDTLSESDLANQASFFSLDSNFKRMDQDAICRTTLFVSIYMNSPTEFCDISDIEASTAPTLLRIGSLRSNAPVHQPHLTAESIAVIFGGHQGSAPGPPIDQICHKDQSSVTKHGMDYHVSRNPDLQGKTKPLSVIIPLVDHRKIYTQHGLVKNYHHIRFGEGFIMSADTSHGGQTTAEFNGWHASLHVNYTSSYHPVDLRIFEIDHLSVALTSPVFMSRMDVPSQTNALRSIANILQEAYRNALDSAATITIAKSLDDTIERMQSLKLEDKSSPPAEVTDSKPPAEKKQKVECFVLDADDENCVDEHTIAREHFPDLTQCTTLHNNVDAGKLMVQKKVGPFRKVPGDGSCGFWTALIDLQSQGKVPANTTLKEFRKMIHDYAMENIDLFVGTSSDGHDSVFKFDNGHVGYTFNNPCNTRDPVKSRKNTFRNEIIAGIYSDRVDYTRYVRKKHWMTAHYVLPIVVHKWKLPTKVLYYTMKLSDTMNNNGIIFFTDIYKYDEQTNNVFLTRKKDTIEKVVGVDYCTMWLKEEDHFDLVHNE